MFDFIRGTLTKNTIPNVVVEVAGIGYRLEVPFTIHEKLEEGKEVTLFTYMLMRNDTFTLFGFSTPQERSVFYKLTSVNGVGPKLGLSILSAFSVDQISALLREQNLDRLKSVPGLGPKTARRLLAELGDTDVLPSSSPQDDSSTKEAVEALMFLGYKRQEARDIIRRISDPNLTTEQLVRQALQELQQSG